MNKSAGKKTHKKNPQKTSAVSQEGKRSRPKGSLRSETAAIDYEGLSGSLDDDRIPPTIKRDLAKNIADIGGNQNLAGMVARQKNSERKRPRLPEIDSEEQAGEDPVGKSSPAVQEEWGVLDFKLRDLRLKLKLAQDNSGAWDSTRANWYAESDALQNQLDTMKSDETIDQTRHAYDDLINRIYDVSIPAGAAWEQVKDLTSAEMANLLSAPDLADFYAYEFLGQAASKTKHRMSQIDESVRVLKDFSDLETVLSSGEYIWRGEVRAARERYRQLQEMLDVVGDLRASGEDPNAMIPGWDARVLGERERLRKLALEAPDPKDRNTFSYFEQKLGDAHSAALSRKRDEKGFLEKGNDFARGVITGILDAFIETGKQAVDVAKIITYAGYRVMGGESWEPELYSDLAKTVDKTGMGTWDVLVAMGEGVIETPERTWKAIKNDDWEAVGRESANLYMLGKAARSGAAGVKNIPARLRSAAGKAAALLRFLKAQATAAGSKGGMSEAAIQLVRKIAMEHNLEIIFRPVDEAVVRLRELGHPGKIKELKMKTVNELDIHLGASADDVGKVGFFEPRLPDNIMKMSRKKALAIAKRYHTRMKEWQTMKETVGKLSDEGIVELRGKVIHDPKTGKAFTGDYDLFEIRRGGSGKNVRFEDLEEGIRRALDKEPVSAEHGDLLSWEPKPGEVEMFANLIRSHRPGGESLIKFTHDGKVEKVHFDD